MPGAKTALIIANGPLPAQPNLSKLVAAAGLIVCADGGANKARKRRLKPDIILGDLDSISPATKKHFSRVPIVLIEDQESTDLEKAISFCVRRGVRQADIVGALGERIDHATGSLGCFKEFGERIELRFHDAYGMLLRVHGTIKVEAKKGQKISLIPLDRCSGITTRNLLYPLNNETLELGKREGISNQATSSAVTVSVRKGTLLLYLFSRA
ncbi:MAG TPA: thiamine diphosphokinase [Bacteroidota bacterium]|jgi:thiamine pyrophosphokinase|nr:thiamine diphosphokinase [Bacteroidota bacterium]